MGLLRARTILFLATIAVYGKAASLGPEPTDQKTPVNLGVLFLYDQEFQEQIIHAHKFQQNIKKNETDYLAALLKGVELRFLDIDEIKLKLTLTHAQNRRQLAVPADPKYGENIAIDGEKTMEKLQLELNQSSSRYTDADIVVFVTGKQVITRVEGQQWLGVAQKAQVCKNKVALVADNGKSFTGTDSLAMQVAILLNASRDKIDNPCNVSDSFLLSSIYGGLQSKFSVCSKQDMVSFLQNPDETCWKNEVTDYYHGELPASYHNTTGYDICTVNHNDNRYIKTCKGEYYVPKWNKTCRVQCCDYFALRTPFLYRQTAADGTPCGVEQICISGECSVYKH